jgi:ribose transport system substrate-binding protein
LRQQSRVRAGIAATISVVALLLLAACGSSSSSSSSSSASATGSATTSSAASSSAGSSGVSYAKAQIAAASAIPTFKLKAPSFSMTKIAGKTIFNIPVTSAVPYVVSVDQAAAKLAAKYGAKWVEYTNQGTPTQWTAGINQAIAQHASVIILAQGIAVQLIVPALQKAKAAGIPVVITHDFQNGQQNTPPPTGPGANVNALTKAFVNVPFWEAARLEADYVIAQTNGKADDVIFTSPDVPPSNGITAAMQKEFTTYCPACKVKVIDVPLADWATKIAPETQSSISSDPSINWITPIYDSMSLFAQQGITAAGKTGAVHIASYNGTPAVMKLIQDGNIMSMDVGENITWLAYATMDQVGRVITGAPIVASGNEETPLRVFTKANINQTGTPPTPNLGYGTAYVTGYGALWK